MTNTTSNAKSYFDLHTEGYARLQRVREVPVRGGRRAQPFLACTVAALVGSAKDPVTRYFDVKVSGADAKKLVESYIGVDDPRQRPLVKFRIGDLWGDAFMRTSGDRKELTRRLTAMKGIGPKTAEIFLRDLPEHVLPR